MKSLNMLIVSLLLLSLSSCGSQKIDHKKEHQSFMKKLERMKKVSTKKDYSSFLKKQKNIKEQEIDQLRGLMSNRENLLAHQETMDSGAPQDIHHFRAKSTKINIRQIEDRIKILESELYTINSQLSALE